MAVSAVLGSVADLLGNAFSNGWRWPLGLAFIVAVLVLAAWVGIRAVVEHRRTVVNDGQTGAPSIRVGRVSAQGGQAVGVNNGVMYQDRDR